MKTYIVEDKGNNIIEYCRKLRDAKSVLNRYGGHRIVMMEGQYFGEGFHKYQMIMVACPSKGRNKYVRLPL